MSQFNFEKEESIIFRPREMPAPGPYYTTLVDMHDVKDFPFDYALYFSTDHHNKEGGIWLYVCNGLPVRKENWKSYDTAISDGDFDHVLEKPDANPIYQDSTQGSGHTETPFANVIDNIVYLTYHKNGIGPSQATLLATSEDGVNFSRINGKDDSVILKYDPEESLGNGHTGYFRWGKNIFAGIKHQYIGYSLHGGGDNYYSALWGSADAIHWDKLHVLEPIEGQGVEDDRLIIWHELDPASIRKLSNGGYAAICGVGNRASGSAARFVELYTIYLADDGVTLTHMSKKLLTRGLSGENDSEELASPSSITIDNEIQLIYVGAKDGGVSNTVMSAIGKFDVKEIACDELASSDQKRHLH